MKDKISYRDINVLFEIDDDELSLFFKELYHYMKDKTNKWFQSEPISTKRRLIKFKKTKITDEFWCIDSNNLDIENNKVYNTTDAFIKRDLKPHFLNVVNHFPKEEQNNFYEFLDRTYLKIKRKKKIKKIKLLQVNKYK